MIRILLALGYGYLVLLILQGHGLDTWLAWSVALLNTVAAILFTNPADEYMR